MTVFVIAVSYNQVIELFPTGGGGYKVATRLLGKHAGLISGSALVVDYVLTIAISIAAGVDALFSFLPLAWRVLKPEAAALFLLMLLVMNLRGVKESIKLLLPIFVGFVLTHAFLIIYGISRTAQNIGAAAPAMKTLPSKTYVARFSNPHPTEAMSPLCERIGLSPVLATTKHPVP